VLDIFVVWDLNSGSLAFVLLFLLSYISCTGGFIVTFTYVLTMYL
jgi:hypothetical protein